MDKIDILKVIIYLIMIIMLLIIFLKVETICNENKPIDYILKEDLEKCYLSIHNFISYNTSFDLVTIGNESNSFENQINERTSKSTIQFVYYILFKTIFD